MQHKDTHSEPLTSRVFLSLVAYRWGSLLPGLWLLAAPRQELLASEIYPVLPAGVLAAAAANTLLVTLFHQRLNHRLLQLPALLGIDMLFVVVLLAVSGGTHSPYYLYALSPVLAGAFFFQMRGALLSAAAFTPLFLAGVVLSWRLTGTAIELDLLTTQTAGILLIAVLLGYPSVLLSRLHRARDELSKAHDALAEQNRALAKARDQMAAQNIELADAHRQLEIIHALTTSLQAAPDVQTVQQRVLEAVTRDLGFRYALIGLLNPINEHLEGWSAAQAPGTQPPGTQLDITASLAAASIAMEPGSGPLVQSLLGDLQPVRLSEPELFTPSPVLNRWLQGRVWLCVPLVLREHPIGVLLVDQAEPRQAAGIEAVRTLLLGPVCSQAAVALGTTMLCIDRAQRLAVERERNRIARDIHDTVAQSLFGITFTLDACIQMLPEDVVLVKEELTELREQASQVRSQVRQSIFDLWPADLALERFKSDLRLHAIQSARTANFQIEFTTRGDFDSLSPRLRQSIYQIAQEAVANAAHHAGADSAQVLLQVENQEVLLQVEDHGRGFQPESEDHRRFGLRGMQERIDSLGGTLEIISTPGAGVTIRARLPRLPGVVYA